MAGRLPRLLLALVFVLPGIVTASEGSESAPVPAGARGATTTGPEESPVESQPTPDAAPAKTESRPAAVPASKLAPAAERPPYRPPLGLTSTPYSESRLRRAESVFLISLPFTAFYSLILVSLASLAINGGEYKMTPEYQITGASLTILGAGFIAWRDSRKN